MQYNSVFTPSPNHRPLTAACVLYCTALYWTACVVGHFPASKARLLKLLDDVSPKGLLVLSGDVHFAEIAGRGGGDGSDSAGPSGGGGDGNGGGVGSGNDVREDEGHDQSKGGKTSSSIEDASDGGERSGGVGESFGPIEVTSSGMTHSCSSPWFGFVCVPVLSAFSAHRWRGLDGYPHINWGALELDWEKQEMHVQVKDAEGKTVLEARKRIGVTEPVPLSSSGGGSSARADGDTRGSAVVTGIPSVYSTPPLQVSHTSGLHAWFVYIAAFLGGIVTTIAFTKL